MVLWRVTGLQRSLSSASSVPVRYSSSSVTSSSLARRVICGSARSPGRRHISAFAALEDETGPIAAAHHPRRYPNDVHKVPPTPLYNSADAGNQNTQSSERETRFMGIREFRAAFADIPKGPPQVASSSSEPVNYDSTNHNKQEQINACPPPPRVVLSGRLWGKREASSNLLFFDLRGGSTDGFDSVQILASRKRFVPWISEVASGSNGSSGEGETESSTSIEAGAETELSFEESIAKRHVGDIVQVVGYPGRTKFDELTLYVESARCLAPVARPLPKAHFGIRDAEKRYARRHVDLLYNPVVRQSILLRATVLRQLREFLDARGFVEVETPVLGSIAGGAAAVPFRTEPASFSKQPLVMRIAPELYLKQLVVGGIERCYEIGKQFRNEGVSPRHNPEFSTCEFYCAYKSYEDLMDWTEEFLVGLAAAVATQIAETLPIRSTAADDSPHAPRTAVIELIDGDENCVQISGPHLTGSAPIVFSRPFRRIDFVSEVERFTGERSIMQLLELHSTGDTTTSTAALLNLCRTHGLGVESSATFPKLLDKLAEEFIEPQCRQPTFIVGHPTALSPLARCNDSNPLLSDRFELFVNHQELCNAYSELNDPEEQQSRFLEQQRMHDVYGTGAEAQLPDERFVRALRDAMPPTAGWGLGLDRLIMLLAGATTIRDVIMFPLLRENTNAELEEE